MGEPTDCVFGDNVLWVASLDVRMASLHEVVNYCEKLDEEMCL